MVVLYPLSCIRSKPIKHSCFDALKHHAIGSFHLPVTLWVCHRSVADFDAELSAPILKFRARELSSIIGANPVWNAKSDHNILEELLRLSSCNLGYRLGLNPLGELIDG